MSITEAPLTGQRSRKHDTAPRKDLPHGSRIRQQRMSAWTPSLTAGPVISSTVLIGLIFIGIGTAMYITIDKHVKEVRIDYTHECRMHLTPMNNNCKFSFILDDHIPGPVYFYYYLEHFFQNIRQFMTSRSDSQLSGEYDYVDYCRPFDKDADGKKIIPCGAMANSMFNDTFRLEHELADKTVHEVPFTTEGITHNGEKGTWFKNPDFGNKTCEEYFQNYAKPPAWSKTICELEDHLENVDFIVWMRPAALPDFIKPYRFLNMTGDYTNGLPAGKYWLTVQYNYPTALTMARRKEFIISNSSWAGGKNYFLAILYIVVGSLAVSAGAFLTCTHWKWGVHDYKAYKAQ